MGGDGRPGLELSPPRPTPIDPHHWNKFWRLYYTTFSPSGTLHSFTARILRKAYPSHHEWLEGRRVELVDPTTVAAVRQLPMSAAAWHQEPDPHARQPSITGRSTSALWPQQSDPSVTAAAGSFTAGYTSTHPYSPLPQHTDASAQASVQPLSGAASASCVTEKAAAAEPASGWSTSCRPHGTTVVTRQQPQVYASNNSKAALKQQPLAGASTAAPVAAARVWRSKEAGGEAAANMAWRHHMARADLLQQLPGMSEADMDTMLAAAAGCVGSQSSLA